MTTPTTGQDCRHATILSTTHDVADARIARWAAAFNSAGWEVEVRGVGDAARGPAHALTVTHRRGTLARLRSAFSLPLTARGDAAVVVDPELAVTGLLARRARILVTDVHEVYMDVAGDRRWARGPLSVAARAAARLSTVAAGRADLTTVADDHVPPFKARRRLVVPNLPADGEIPDVGEPQGPPRAVYIGNITRSRGLEDMLAAVAGAPAWHLDLVGPLVEGNDAATRAAATGKVRLHGRLEPRRAWGVAAGAWVGLALLRDTRAYRAAVPSKLYEYLAAGLPVITSDLPRMSALVQSSGAGAVVRDPQEAAAMLRRWADHPHEMAAHRSAARAWAAAHLPARSLFADAVATVEDLL